MDEIKLNNPLPVFQICSHEIGGGHGNIYARRQCHVILIATSSIIWIRNISLIRLISHFTVFWTGCWRLT
jgi:hypothetical protein